MKRLLGSLIGGVLVVTLGGCSDTHKKAVAVPPPPTVVSHVSEGKGKLEQHETVTVTATVAAINQKTREVTLRGSGGTLETIKVGDEVRNLPQVKKGDQVVATYHESIALQLKKPGEATPGITESGAADRAALGEKPGAVGAHSTTITAPIAAVNRKTQMVTLKGPKGKVVHVHVRDPKRLEQVKKGDLVEITYTEAVAIAVEAAPKTK